MKVGSMVRIRPDRLISEDSRMPLWGTTTLMDAELAGDTITVGEITGWMGPEDTALIVEREETDSYRYTPIFRLLVSRGDGGVGWIDSIYLREIKT